MSEVVISKLGFGWLTRYSTCNVWPNQELCDLICVESTVKPQPTNLYDQSILYMLRKMCMIIFVLFYMLHVRHTNTGIVTLKVLLIVCSLHNVSECTVN